MDKQKKSQHSFICVETGIRFTFQAYGNEKKKCEKLCAHLATEPKKCKIKFPLQCAPMYYSLLGCCHVSQQC